MDQHQFWGNVTSVAAIIGSLLGYVPAVAGLVALVWYFIQIYESQTARRWLTNRRVRKIAKLRAKLILLEAQHHVQPVLPEDDGG
jgi:hypothetical protein